MASAALLLAMGAAVPAWAGDGEDCIAVMGGNAANLLNTQPAKVVSACRRLAEQGYGMGGFVLGFRYENGFGVPKDYVAAWMWYDSAVGHGLTDGGGGDAAVALRDDLAKRMTPSEIERARATSAARTPVQKQ
jgi:TPR repeat protein